MRLLHAMAVAFSDDGVEVRNGQDRGAWGHACSAPGECGGEEEVHRSHVGAVRTPHKVEAYGVLHAVEEAEGAARHRRERLAHKSRPIHRRCPHVPGCLPVPRTGPQSPDSVCQGGE